MELSRNRLFRCVNLETCRLGGCRHKFEHEFTEVCLKSCPNGPHRPREYRGDCKIVEEESSGKV
jgi:hypothetical protein